MKSIFFIVFVLILSTNSYSQSVTLLRSSLGVSGSSNQISINGNSYRVQQSIGQGSPIRSFTLDGSILFQGFIQPHSQEQKASASTLNVRVYPNPFSKNITLQFGNDTHDDVSVIIMDILGRTVFKKTFKGSSEIDFDPGDVSPGQVIIKISTPQKQYVTKLIKEL